MPLQQQLLQFPTLLPTYRQAIHPIQHQEYFKLSAPIPFHRISFFYRGVFLSKARS